MILPLLAGAALFIQAAPARQVLVYLANEPAPTQREHENALRIAAWLASSPDEGEQLLSQGILLDLTLFPEVVATDVAAISRHPGSMSGVVIAHNRILKSGLVLVGRGNVPQLAPIIIEPPADAREESNPLSNVANVKRVLRLAATNFDPVEYEFVIVVESHGDEVYAVTPRLGLPTEGLTKEKLFERVRGSDNAFIQRYGITTVELLELLATERRHHGFRTKLVVLASCESTIERLLPEVPTALVAAGGLPLLFGAIDFEKVLTSSEPTLDRAFISVLTPAPFELADPALVVRRRWSFVGGGCLGLMRCCASCLFLAP